MKGGDASTDTVWQGLAWTSGALSAGAASPLGTPGERLSDAVARRMGTAILSGAFLSGRRIADELRLASDFGISREVVREALMVLAGKGLIEKRSDMRGAIVAARGRWNIFDGAVLAWMFEGKPNPGLVRDLFEVREIVETRAASLAAARRSEKQRDAMARCMEVLAREGFHSDAGCNADRAFHQLLLAATGNETLASMGAAMAAAIRWTTHHKLSSGTRRDAYAEHCAVFEAVDARDPQRAERAMTGLLGVASAQMHFSD